MTDGACQWVTCRPGVKAGHRQGILATYSGAALPPLSTYNTMLRGTGAPGLLQAGTRLTAYGHVALGGLARLNISPTSSSRDLALVTYRGISNYHVVTICLCRQPAAADSGHSIIFEGDVCGA